MSIIFFVLGGLVLAYFGYCMTLPQFTRPLLILRNGGAVLVVGIVLIIIGVML